MEDESSHSCDCFIASNRIFHHHDRGLTKFHAGSEQPLVCVVINNTHYPVVKSNHTTVIMHLGNIERSLESFLLSFEILQAESSAADVNQTNFNVKLSTNWEAAKNLGAFGLPRPPFESPLKLMCEFTERRLYAYRPIIFEELHPINRYFNGPSWVWSISWEVKNRHQFFGTNRITWMKKAEHTSTVTSCSKAWNSLVASRIVHEPISIDLHYRVIWRELWIRHCHPFMVSSIYGRCISSHT